MNRNLSVFLDLLRLVAALLVLVGHAGEVYHLQMPDILGHSAKEGVAVFFVLSGFVIAFVTSGKEPRWQDFARARLLRMVSVVPLAVLVLFVCHALGSAINPAAYGLAPGGEGGNGGAIGDPPGWAGALRYLTFSNEIWFDRVVMSTGAPFWSLGFEVAYYIIFAALFYGRGNWRWLMVAGWLLAFGPRIAVALPLWLVGVGAWHLVRSRVRLGPKTGVLALILVALLALAWRKGVGIVAIPLFEWPDPLLLCLSMGYYLGLGILVAAAIVFFAACVPDRPVWPPAVERVVRTCAGASFTIYIAHLPVMVLLAACWPNQVGTPGGALLATGLTIVAMFALAELGERRKSLYAGFLDRILICLSVDKKRSEI